MKESHVWALPMHALIALIRGQIQAEKAEVSQFAANDKRRMERERSYRFGSEYRNNGMGGSVELPWSFKLGHGCRYV